MDGSMGSEKKQNVLLKVAGKIYQYYPKGVGFF